MVELLIKKYEAMEKPVLSLQICNVCAIANLRCHLNLSHIAQNGIDVEYDSFLNVLKTKLRYPKVGLAQFWSNGKMSVFGCDAIDNARKGCRILARRIKKLGYNAKFENFQIVNILTKLQLPFKVRIHEMVTCDPLKFMYEPELDPNLYFYPNPKNRGRKFNEYRSMAKITSNGKVTIHSMTMDLATIIGDEVYKLSIKYIMEEIIDPLSQTNVTVSPDASSQPKPRKRVLVKTYIEDSDSAGGASTTESNNDSAINVISESPIDQCDDSSSGMMTTTTSHSNGVHQSLLVSSDSSKGVVVVSSPSSLSSSVEPYHNQSQTNYYVHSKLVNELSLVEAQQVLDDLLN